MIIKNYPEYSVNESGEVFGPRGKMTPFKQRNGYLRLVFTAGCEKRQHFYVHRLVAQQFIPNPKNLPEVNHLDTNKLNNSVDNLEWCTRKENQQHASRAGRLCHGTEKYNSVLTEADVIWIRSNYKMHSIYYNTGSMARTLNCGVGTVRAVIKGYTWKYLIQEDDDWDRQMIADAEAGKFDEMVKQVTADYFAGRFK